MNTQLNVHLLQQYNPYLINHKRIIITARTCKTATSNHARDTFNAEESEESNSKYKLEINLK